MRPVRSGARSQRRHGSDGGSDRAPSFLSQMVRIPRALKPHIDTPSTDGDPATHRAGLARIAAAAMAVSADPHLTKPAAAAAASRAAAEGGGAAKLPESASATSASGAGVSQSPWTPALASRGARSWDGLGALSGGSASGRLSLAQGRVGGPLAVALPCAEASSTTATPPPRDLGLDRVSGSHPHNSPKAPVADSRPPTPRSMRPRGVGESHNGIQATDGKRGTDRHQAAGRVAGESLGGIHGINGTPSTDGIHGPARIAGGALLPGFDQLAANPVSRAAATGSRPPEVAADHDLDPSAALLLRIEPTGALYQLRHLPSGAAIARPEGEDATQTTTTKETR